MTQAYRVCDPPIYWLEKYIIPFLDSLDLKEKYLMLNLIFLMPKKKKSPACRATMNQHLPAHHPLDAHYYSVVDEPQLR